MKKFEGVCKALVRILRARPPAQHGLEVHVELKEELIHQGSSSGILTQLLEDGKLCNAYPWWQQQQQRSALSHVNSCSTHIIIVLDKARLFRAGLLAVHGPASETCE